MFGAVQFLNTFNSVKVTELPPVWERAGLFTGLIICNFVIC